MDWDQVTRSWVEQGLVEERQRAGLRAWLEANAVPEPGPAERPRFADTLLPGLVASGTWLVTGSTLVLTTFVGGWLGDHPDAVLLALALAQLLAGAVLLAARLRAVAHGAWAAAWLVLTAAIGIRLVEANAHTGWAALAGGLLYLVAGVVGTAARMPGVCWSGAIAGLLALGTAVDAAADPVTAALVAASLAATGAVAGGRAIAPERFEAVQVQGLTPTLVALTALVALGTDLGGHHWAFLASGGLTAGWGVLLVAAAALSRSRWLLAAALLSWGVAELCILFQVGSPVLAASVLGVEGVLVLGLAAVWVVALAGRGARRAARSA